MLQVRLLVLALIVLLIAVSIPATAQARTNLRKAAKPMICLDEAYNVKLCQNSSPLQFESDDSKSFDYNIFEPPITYLRPISSKSSCAKRRKKPTLLNALFPNLPDLYFDLKRFALDIELSSEVNQVELSSIQLGYRNCW